MIVPSESDIQKLQEATYKAGYDNYSVVKKPSASKAYSSYKRVPNPYLIVKNRETNRLFQIKWAGDFKAAVNNLLAEIASYENKRN